MRPHHRTLLRTATGALALLALALTACEPAPIPTNPGTQRVVLFGDSIPSWLIRDGSAGVPTAKITLVNGTLDACEGAKGNPPARARTGKVVPTPAACSKGWPSMYPPHLATPADIAIVMSSTHAMLDHQLSGTWRHPCHSPARTWYQDDMTARLEYLQTKATQVVLVLPAWPGTNSGWIMPADYVVRADCVRSVLKAAAKAAGATVLDFGAYLCPTGPSACKPWRTGDGMHIDKVRAPSALGFVTNSSIDLAGDPATPDTAATGPAFGAQTSDAAGPTDVTEPESPAETETFTTAPDHEPADDQPSSQVTWGSGRSGAATDPVGQPR